VTGLTCVASDHVLLLWENAKGKIQHKVNKTNMKCQLYILINIREL